MSKGLYDLCRKYKYFYKKKEDIENFHRKYHDVDLSEDIQKADVDLAMIENSILVELLIKMNVKFMSIETEREVMDCYPTMFGNNCRCTPHLCGSTTDMTVKDSERFVHAVNEYAMKGRGYLL